MNSERRNHHLDYFTEEDNAPLWIRRVEYRPLFSNDNFVHHLLESGYDTTKKDDNEQITRSTELIKKWTKEEELAKAKNNFHCVIRSQFLNWYQKEMETGAQVNEIMANSANINIAYAKLWFWISRERFAEEENSAIVQAAASAKLQFHEDSKERHIIDECQEWVWAGERLALLNYYFGNYGKLEVVQAENAMRGWKMLGQIQFQLSNIAMNLSNMTRFHIRRYFEDRNGVIFNNFWLDSSGTTTSMEIRTKILNIISAFQLNFETNFITELTLGSSKKTSLQLTLNQECTRSAYKTITQYIQALSNEVGKISVQCVAADRKLVLPVEQTRDDLKEPILELSRIERVTLGSDEISTFVDECCEIVSNYLNVNEIQRGALLSSFTRLIFNEQISINASEKYLAERLRYARQCQLKLMKCPKSIDHGIFCIRLEMVWEALKERAHNVILRCSQLIRENFHLSLVDLNNAFYAFKRLLSFRSTDPSIMLNNKAEVNVLCEQDIPRAVESLKMAYERMYDLSQLLQFDASEHEHLIGIVAMRRALPHQIADHAMFFQRRLHIFNHYVRNRQDFIRHSAEKASIKLKIINTFSNAQDTEKYLEIMVELRPLATSLLNDVAELNKQEQAIKLPLTRMPEIEAIAGHVDSLQNLLEWTKKYLDFQREFYARHRIDARVDECREFLNECVGFFKRVSGDFSTHKTARHFIVQVRNDIDKFLQRLPVLEVVACAQLRDRHWDRMSEIAGIDLSVYANSSIEDFCKLDLKAYAAKLKPIAFAAEREGEILDQANYIADYWNEAAFEMESSSFWNIQLPTNLSALIRTAREHYEKIKQFRDSGNQSTNLNIKLSKWLSNLEAIIQLLEKWNNSLKMWKRISVVMQHSYAKMRMEFGHFRWCAKYWKRLARFVDDEGLVLKMLEAKHVNCWLRLVDDHLTKLIQGVKDHLTNLRSSSARISLLSDFDFLKLLSETAIHKKLAIIRHECFPYFRDFIVKDNTTLCAINLDGEMIEFPSNVNHQLLHGEGTLSFILEVEKAIHELILRDYLRFSENHDATAYRVAKQMDLCVMHSVGGRAVSSIPSSVKHICHRPATLAEPSKKAQEQAKGKHIISERSVAVSEALALIEEPNIPKFYMEAVDSEKRLELKLDFIPSTFFCTFPTIDQNFVHKWSSGKVPFYYGSLKYLHQRIFTLAGILFSSIHFINCHEFLHNDVLRIIVRASMQESILLILENFDQLPESSKFSLYSQLQNTKREYIRLILCSTLSSIAKTIDRNPVLFLADGFVKRNAATSGFPNIISLQRFMLSGMAVSQTVGRAAKAFGASNVEHLNIVQEPISFHAKNMKFLPHRVDTTTSQHTNSKSQHQQSHLMKSQPLENSLLEIFSSIAGSRTSSQPKGDGSGNSSRSNGRQFIRSPTTRRDRISYYSLNYASSFAVACCGSIAKQTVIDALNSNFEVSWIYFDAFTIQQLISNDDEFAKMSSGIIINNLKEIMRRNESERKLFTFEYGDDTISQNASPDRDHKTTENTQAPSDIRHSELFKTNEFRPSTPKIARFIVFYGLQQFRLYFPVISSLFCTSLESPLPGAYITLPDGSNFYASKNISFILCLPTCSSEILEWIELYNIQTVIIDDPPSTSLTANEETGWVNARHVLLGILRRIEYIDIVSNLVEYAIIPAFQQLHLHTACATQLMFEYLNQNLTEIVPLLQPSNCAELLRFSVSSVCFNFLVIYLIDVNFDTFDKTVQNLCADADRHVIDAPKIPSHISRLRFEVNFSFQKKNEQQESQQPSTLLSQQKQVDQKKVGRWVVWMDEPLFSFTVDTKLSISDTFIIYPEVDRFLAFSTRQFRDSQSAASAGLLITGPRFAGKTSVVKKLINVLQSYDNELQFLWLNCSHRFNLQFMQSCISSIIRNADPSKTIVLIVDNFHFDEPAAALLEMYIDRNLLVSETGSQISSFKKIKLILIMDEEQIRSCQKYGLFSRKCCVFYVRTPSEPSVTFVMEQIMNHHLLTRTFSTEYKALISPIVNATMRIIKFFQTSPSRYLLLAVRLSKALMYAFPDNTPDLDSMLRLWIHELIRILFDSESNEENRHKNLAEFIQIFNDEFKKPIDKLFTTQMTIDDNVNMADETNIEETSKRVDGILTVRQNHDREASRASILSTNSVIDSSIEHLLYSELCGIEIMDGIPYGMVLNRAEFNRTFENLHFEHMRSNADSRINVVVTDYISEHCQRIMRVTRQHSEHMVLAAQRSGVGRYQCVRLAAFGLIGQVYHIYFDVNDSQSFENCWKRVMRRVLLFIAAANHSVNVIVHLDFILDKIPTEWLLMFKQWIQRPVVSEILTDDLILKLGESIVDSEKALATLLQSSNIRLPGQRVVNFLPFETIKNVNALKAIMSERIMDLVTFVFMVIVPSNSTASAPTKIHHISPRQQRQNDNSSGKKSGRSPRQYSSALSRHAFDWCTMDYFQDVSVSQIAQIKKKIVDDCLYNQKHQLSDTIEQVFNVVAESLERSTRLSFSFASLADIAIISAALTELRPTTKMMHDLFQSVVTLYNLKFGNLNKVSTILKSAVFSLQKLRTLHIAGHALTERELTTKLDDNDLTLLLFKRKLHDTMQKDEDFTKKIIGLEEECKKIEAKLFKQNAKITGSLQESEEELHKIMIKLSHYTPSDYKKLATLKEPTLSTRLSIEAIRLLTDENYSQEKNLQVSWDKSRIKLLTLNLYNVLLAFNPLMLSNSRAKVDALRRIVDNREFKPLKMRGDAPLAADLSHWTLCVFQIAKTNKLLRGRRRVADELSSQLLKMNKELSDVQKDAQKCKSELAAFEREIQGIDEELARIRHAIEHRRRSDRLLTSLGRHESRWHNTLKAVDTRIDSLIGSSIFEAGFRTLLSSQIADVKMIAFTQWKRILTKQLLKYDEKYCSTNFLTISLLRDIHWHFPWPIIFNCPRKKRDSASFRHRPRLVKATAAAGGDPTLGDDSAGGISTSTLNLVEVLERIFPMTITIDMAANGGLSWCDSVLLAEVHRASQLNCTIILYNVTSSPPAFWYELLNREPNRDTMCVIFEENRTLHFGAKFRIIFVCSYDIDLIKFDKQFIEMLQPILVEEELDTSDTTIVEVELSGDEEDLLKTLNDYSANEILDSQDLAERIVRTCDNLFTVYEEKQQSTQEVNDNNINTASFDISQFISR